VEAVPVTDSVINYIFIKGQPFAPYRFSWAFFVAYPKMTKKTFLEKKKCIDV